MEDKTSCQIALLLRVTHACVYCGHMDAIWGRWVWRSVLGIQRFCYLLYTFLRPSQVFGHFMSRNWKQNSEVLGSNGLEPSTLCLLHKVSCHWTRTTHGCVFIYVATLQEDR